PQGALRRRPAPAHHRSDPSAPRPRHAPPRRLRRACRSDRGRQHGDGVGVPDARARGPAGAAGARVHAAAPESVAGPGSGGPAPLAQGGALRRLRVHADRPRRQRRPRAVFPDVPCAPLGPGRRLRARGHRPARGPAAPVACPRRGPHLLHDHERCLCPGGREVLPRRDDGDVEAARGLMGVGLHPRAWAGTSCAMRSSRALGAFVFVVVSIACKGGMTPPEVLGAPASEGGSPAREIATWSDEPGACPKDEKRVDLAKLQDLEDASRGEGAYAGDPPETCYLIKNGTYLEGG